jgi:hypothetical protein
MTLSLVGRYRRQLLRALLQIGSIHLGKKKCGQLAAFSVDDGMALPEAPRTADVIAQGHYDQNEEGKEAGTHGHLDELRLIFDVHEEQDDDHHFGAGNGECYDRIEYPKIDFGRYNSQCREEQQCSEDRRVDNRRDNVMLGVLRIRHI